MIIIIIFIDGLAVDWINDKLYWVDGVTARIEVSNLDGSNRTVLFSNDIAALRAIIVDPTTRCKPMYMYSTRSTLSTHDSIHVHPCTEYSILHRYFFWTDWGFFPRIERASMDGKERITLHSQGLVLPYALTMDYTTHTLYWADAALRVLESSSLDGSNRRPILSEHLRQPFSVTMFEDQLYWTDLKTRSIFSVTKFAKQFQTKTDANGISLYQDLLGRNATEVSIVN